MKKIIYILGLFAFINGQVNAQSSPPPNSNEQARLEAEKQGYSGHFTHLLEDKYQITVNYSFTPKIPSNEVNFTLHTPEPRPLSIAIKDASGKIVTTWEPKQENYLQQGSLDVSKLKKGKYTYVILWEGDSTHEIDFEKQ